MVAIFDPLRPLDPALGLTVDDAPPVPGPTVVGSVNPAGAPRSSFRGFKGVFKVLAAEGLQGLAPEARNLEPFAQILNPIGFRA